MESEDLKFCQMMWKDEEFSQTVTRHVEGQHVAASRLVKL
jgi:hypothetical protein